MPSFVRSSLYLVYVVIVAGLVTAIVADFRSGNPKPAAAKPATHQAAQTPAKKPAGNSGSSTTQPSQTSNQSSSSSNQLTNTGPGNTIGLFVLASVAGALAYRWRLIRRLN